MQTEISDHVQGMRRILGSSRRDRRGPLAFGLISFVLWAGAGMSALADTTFYYYRDAQGVLHFTNRDTAERVGPWSVFAVFRNHPGMSRDELERLARKYSYRHGVDWCLVRAVIEVESQGNPSAVSPKGAEGLMQIMPVTQQDLGLAQPFDPEANVEAGVRYLREMIDRFGSLNLAVAAYNAGPGQVERYGGVPPFKETQAYVYKVLSTMHKLRAE